MAVAASRKSLISLEAALAMTRERNRELHLRHLNPRFARLLQLIDADLPVVRAEGSYFWDSSGRRYLDFLTGFAALGLGNGHPRVKDALNRVESMPVLIQGLNHLAAALAHNLAALAPGNLQRLYFANSGTETIDASIKLARAATGRKKILSCAGCFHGRSIGALSLIGNPVFRESFEPLVPETSRVPYGDPYALELALRGRDVAGFILEPVQGEGGINVPPTGYLRSAREICSRYGTLMIVDEVQAGLGRTGRLFAVDRELVVPDIILLGKSLGGGMVPISAVITTDSIFHAAGGSTPRSPLQTPTFGSNARACAAGIATLEVMTEENLPARADSNGDYFLTRLQQLKSRHSAIVDVRGQGLMIGVEFSNPTTGLSGNLLGGSLKRIGKGLLCGMVIRELYIRHQILTAYTLNNPDVLRFEPALNVERADIDSVVEALDETLHSLKGYLRATMTSLHGARRTRTSSPK